MYFKVGNVHTTLILMSDVDVQSLKGHTGCYNEVILSLSLFLLLFFFFTPPGEVWYQCVSVWAQWLWQELTLQSTGRGEELSVYDLVLFIHTDMTVSM